VTALPERDAAPPPDCRADAQDPVRRDVEYLLDILGGKCRLQAVSTIAALGVPDRIADQPMSTAQLAAQLGCGSTALDSIMRLVAGLGFFECPEPGVYALTHRGQQLRREELGSLAEFAGAPEQWDPWSRLRETMVDGEKTAFEAVAGTDLYDFMARTPDAAQRYDDAIAAFTRHEAHALCEKFDFSDAERLVDVGGGRGTLLLTLLARWRHLSGVLYELPHVAERARALMSAEQLRRVQVVGGDFFETMPEGADIYLIKHVLHNWDDRRARDLLARCAAAMTDSGRVLVIEAIAAPDNRPDLACLLNLEMQVLTGGRERRKPALRRLFAEAGLKVQSIAPLTHGSWLLVGARAT